MRVFLFVFACLMPFIVSCQDQENNTTQDDENIEDEMEMNSINMNEDEQAVITAVEISGSENNYTFNVTIKSPDKGCDQYADWWEVFDQDGNLIYRRILGHSHVNEQPFTRSGGPVAVSVDTYIYVRAHMNSLGYGSYVFAGTINKGLDQELIGVELHSDLAEITPLPKDCVF